MTYVEISVVLVVVLILVVFTTQVIIDSRPQATQVADVNNIVQLGMILFADANEHGGYYRSNATFTETINKLIQEGVLPETKIVGGTGVSKITGTNATSENLAFAYFPGLTTADNGGLPLLITRGTGVVITNGKIIYDVRTNRWKGQGLAIYYLNGSAEFKKAKVKPGWWSEPFPITNQFAGEARTNFPAPQWP